MQVSRKYARVTAWGVVVLLGLLVLARVATGLPVAAQAGVMVGDPTATPTSPAPTATPVATVAHGIVNPSFETGDLTGWQVAVSDNNRFNYPQVLANLAGTKGMQPDWPAMHGQYSVWTLWAGCGPGWSRLMQDLTVPTGRPVLVFDYRAMWDLTPAPTGADKLTGLVITAPDQPFYVIIEEAGGGKELARHLILTAPGGQLGDVAAASYTSTVEDTGILNAVIDMREFAGQSVRLVLEWQMPGCWGTFGLMQVDDFRWKQGWSQPRTDVSVIVYGGWNDIPARLWVGGTEQETLYTAVNSYGDAQAMWTFYPDGTWPVTVDVDLPAGLDPDQWELKLVRISSPTLGWSNDEPGAAATSIVAGQQYQFVYQLVSK